MQRNLTSVLQCIACRRHDNGARGWRMYLVPGDTPWTATLCPECAEREVGEDER